MAVYKVIQDIEAEDRLVGFLTLKGFIYAAIAALLAFINVRLLMSEALGPIKYIFILMFFFPMILFGVLASPLGREQPTEVWLLARIRFLFKPRKRIWNQLGINKLVVITAPVKKDQHLVKDLSQTEVSSRLQALAQTLDSRGWAVKNVAVNLSPAPAYRQAAQVAATDRLAPASDTEQPMPVLDVHEADDILDEQSNPTAQNFESLIQRSEESRRQALAAHVEQVRAQTAAQAETEEVSTESDPETQKLLNEMHERARFYAASSSSAPQTVKLELSQSGNDLSVAAISRLANAARSGVEVPLH